jgi:hypothetical protein
MNIDNVRTVSGLGCNNDQDCKGTGAVCVQNKCDCGDGYIRDHGLCMKLPGERGFQLLLSLGGLGFRVVPSRGKRMNNGVII